MITRYVNSAAFGGPLYAITETREFARVSSMTRIRDIHRGIQSMGLAKVMRLPSPYIIHSPKHNPRQSTRLEWFAILAQLDPKGKY